MGKAKTVVKILEINSISSTGYGTKDARYNVKYPIKKIIHKCLKLGFSFKVGFRNNTLIHNMNYIEIISDWFTKKTFGERVARDEQCKKLRVWLFKGEK